MKKGRLFFYLAILILLSMAALGFAALQRGFSARDRPSALEAALARRARKLATPGSAKNQKNPLQPTPELLTEARHHFADHCAVCHANDGSGNTEVGQNLYPKAPDMRLAGTQSLTDGEIYYIIHNGIRFTGMPAWGEDDKDEDSWKLVIFIRHLPQQTPAETKEMESFNPKSRSEQTEEQNEEDFLNGKSPTANEPHHH